MSAAQERILITGATGFLGSWIISRLACSSIHVIAIDINDDYRRLKTLCPDLPADRIDYHICDITNTCALESLIKKTRPTGIIHLAALQIPACRALPAAGAAVNIIGHVNVFEASRKFGIKRIIYTSSIAAKPRGPDKAPSNLYGVYKKTGEEIARIYWRDHKISSLGLRPSIVYGLGRDDGETSAITKAIKAAALGKSYKIPFTTRSCFQFAGDLADIFIRAALSSWEGALLSDITDRVASVDEVLAAIREVVPEAQVGWSGETRVSPSSDFDVAPLRQVIGDWRETPLLDGIRQTIERYRASAVE